MFRLSDPGVLASGGPVYLASRIITPLTHAGFHCIRQIRNKCAHFATTAEESGHQRVSFKTCQIRDWYKQLKHLDPDGAHPACKNQ